MATDFDRDDRLDGLLRDTLRSQPASGPCIDASALAAWADGALTPEETAATDAHLASCARCRELAATLSAIVEADETPAAVVPFPSRPNVRWRVIAGAMSAVAASVLIWVAVRDESPVLESTAALKQTEQSQPGAMGGNVAAPAADPQASGRSAEPSARQQLAEAAREAERRMAQPGQHGQQGQQGQQGTISSRPDAKLAQEKAARTAAPSQRAVEPPPAGFAAIPQPVPSTPPPAPVMAPTPLPPPPAAPVPTATAAARSSTVTGLPQTSLNINLDNVKPADPRQATELFVAMPPIIAEFVAGADMPAVDAKAFARAAGGRGGGRGGGGGGGGAAAASGAGAQQVSGDLLSLQPVRWRLRGAISTPNALLPSMAALERSSDGGTTWQQVPIPVLTTPLLTSGTAPANSVCWLVGRTGIVLLSTDGTTFRQVTKPVDADLVSVRATDQRSATVTTADGRTFSTTDGGLTWTSRSEGPFIARPLT